MIHQPPIDDLAKKVGSKYALCVVASKRARQIMETTMNQGLTDLPNGEKPLSIAAKEIQDGKLVATND